MRACQALMLAVVEQAMMDLRSSSARIRWEARGWFLGRSAGSHLFTFTRICREFGYDPAQARAQILARGALGDGTRRGTH